MRPSLQLCLRLGSLLATLATAPAESKAAAEPQFQRLFTRPGVVSEGWVVRDWIHTSKPPKWPVVWEVDADGILYGTGRYAPGSTGDRWIGTWLLSEREYEDFILELEFSFKYSYFPNAMLEQLSGALYLVSAAKEQAYVPGEWNHYRIEMRGPKIKVWLNQRLVQDVDLDTLTRPANRHGEGQELLDAKPGAQRPRRGHIGLQDLSESGETLLFRNVRVAELN